MIDNNDKSGNINFKRKTNIFTKKNIFITISIILLAIITGITSVSYVLNKLDISNYKKVSDDKFGVLVNSDTQRVIDTVGPSIVTIGESAKALESHELPNKNVSGVITNKDGLILTSYSAIENFKGIYVKLTAKGAKPTKGILLGKDAKLDLALIKIPGDDLTPVKMAKDAEIKEGNIVFALGNSTSNSYIGVITPGIITSTNHTININDDMFRTIQTSAVMNDENFGGVLCNTKGEMVGMNSKLFTDLYKKDSLYFAIGSEALKAAENEIIKSSDVLGIKGSQVKVADREEENGFYIEDVVDGGRAEKAGMKVTDIIIKANNKKISSYEDLIEIIKTTKQGGKINFTILRNGIEKNINITL